MTEPTPSDAQVVKLATWELARATLCKGTSPSPADVLALAEWLAATGAQASADTTPAPFAYNPTVRVAFDAAESLNAAALGPGRPMPGNCMYSSQPIAHARG